MAAYTTVDDAGLFFNPKLYTGTDSSNAITGVGFQPDMTWIKNRDATEDHFLVDSVRGASLYIEPNTTLATTSTTGKFTSLDSDGFTVTGSDAQQNGSGVDYVSWNWKAGTTSGITTDGNTTITPSAYSFNQSKGISILNYTGNGVGGAKVAHGLGVTPRILVTKLTTRAGYYYVHNIVKGDNSEAYWNDDQTFSATTVNGITPDSVNFALEGTSAATNGSGDAYFCVCFADVQGYSKFGSYVGNGNADGTFVYTGFKPAFVQTKNVDLAGEWFMYDNKRPGANAPYNYILSTNTDYVEVTSGGNNIDLLSNGFKATTTGGYTNGSGNTIVYMAWAQDPFVNSEGVPNNAR